MTATFAHPTHAVSRKASRGVMAAIRTAVLAALARAKARHEYRQLLACDDEIMRDVGVTRDDVRQALLESGGRL